MTQRIKCLQVIKTLSNNGYLEKRRLRISLFMRATPEDLNSHQYLLVITPKADFQQFVERNCIMRAMARLVIFRTDFDFAELKSLELTEFRLERELDQKKFFTKDTFYSKRRVESHSPKVIDVQVLSAPVPFMFPKIDSYSFEMVLQKCC